MLHVEDWAEIRRLHFAEQMPIKKIARRLGVSKNTVKAKLAADAPPRYERVAVGSSIRWALDHAQAVRCCACPRP